MRYLEQSELSPILSDDQLHNLNSHDYLRNVFDAVQRWLSIENTGANCVDFLKVFESQSDYNPTYPYGDLYTKFFEAVERDVVDETVMWPEAMKSTLLKALYENRNNVISRSASVMAQFKVSHQNCIPTAAKPVNQFTPCTADTSYEKVRTGVTTALRSRGGKTGPSLFAARQLSNWGVAKPFLPMFLTNITSVRGYCYSEQQPIEIRMGMQVPSTAEGAVYLYHVYEAWLESVRENYRERENLITHVYFNCLGADKIEAKAWDLGVFQVNFDTPEMLERCSESAKTDELIKAEERHPNLAVITLPSDKGFLDKMHYLQRDECISIATAKRDMFAIPAGDESTCRIKDFYISEAVEQKIYGDQKKEILNTLLEKSFRLFLGSDYDPEVKISQAQFQAIYFHFIKFEFTDYILTKLDPIYFNFTCKDGIDRGGIASLYYNLLKSIEIGAPINEIEFLENIDGPPALVKGRAMNGHRDVIWNVIDYLIAGKGLDNKAPEWLLAWRDNNIPAKLQSPMRVMVASPTSYLGMLYQS